MKAPSSEAKRIANRLFGHAPDHPFPLSGCQLYDCALALDAFAEQAVKAEREACARRLEELEQDHKRYDFQELADAIRARGGE